MADLRDPGAWARLRNAVAEPVREMIAVEIDTQARAREVVARLLALGTEPPQSRPHLVIEFSPARDEPADLLVRGRTAAADWPSERGLLFLLDTGEPAPTEDDARPVAFWRGTNLLREQWDALDCQTLFLLLPSNYRLLSSAADHLKRWMPLKVHLVGGGARYEPEPPPMPVNMAEAMAASERLKTLDAQLRQAIQRGEPPETFVRRYYLPMFAAAVALDDYDRACRLRKKLGRVEIAEPDLGGWFNVSFNYELGRYRLAEAQAVAEEHLRWARERGLPLEESIALFNMGSVVAERRDSAAAEGWYRKALAIKEKQGDEHGAASSYHQLGILAQEQRDFAAAEAWYRKALEIEEKQGDEHSAAKTYHQLGRIAEEQGDFAAAEAWYRKSLEIEEKQGDEHGAAKTYHQLGMIAEEQGDFAGAARLFLRALGVFASKDDPYSAEIAWNGFVRLLRSAPPEIQAELRALGRAATGDEKMREAEANLPPPPVHGHTAT
ncbi:MAG: tetratricopeptide repeat protein [Limisphaerales bacterium]